MDKLNRYNAMIVCQCGASAQAEFEESENSADIPGEPGERVFFVNKPLKIEAGLVMCGSCGKEIRSA